MIGKLKGYRLLKGTITCDTGLHIGGSAESIEIGAMENPVIRHPLTDEPYVPGSSLKGKVRSLLELTYGKVKGNGEPCGCATCEICRVFGPHKTPKHQLGPTRILVRDASLTGDWRATLEKAQEERGLFYVETKTENMVNRLTGTAEHPRPVERVPAGAQFDFEIAVRLFEGDNDDEIISLIEEGLALLQQDYLGGSGSRGYGKVSLEYRVV